jgi:hypothetical protein
MVRRRSVAVVAAIAGVAAAALTASFVACGARSGLDTPTVDVRVSHDAEAFLDGDAFVEADAVIDSPVETGPRPLDCAEAGVLYIYVIAEDNSLYSFNPADGEFTLIGVINCPDPGGLQPFSMAVDHTGVAYVVFYDGYLFRVSTKTASCEATPYVPNQHGVTRFGMGFVATVDDAGNGSETLFVAPDNGPNAGDQPNLLATIDLTSFVLTTVGNLGTVEGIPVSSAELTSTRGDNLYGFFSPMNTSPPAYIVHIDPATAGILSAVELPSVEEGNGWAFGFWGGDFYTFTGPNGTSTIVTRYRPSDESITVVAMTPPDVLIVGAGVSTCAPQE